LISNLSSNSQKVTGLAGATLGTIIQSLFCLISGIIIGLAYAPKLAAVGIACIPLVIGTGFIRLHVVVMKDKKNKNAHEDSAKLACEVAGAIRTVASLTREEECCKAYAASLDVPLRNALRSTIWSTLAYALTQSMGFFVIALMFWYGTRLIVAREYPPVSFFVCLMSLTFAAINTGQ
jgi:ATP-binding cassette, subfamily B (MDR/TAP), member 1